MVVLVLPMVVFLCTFLGSVEINYLESILLFFALPSLYLSLRARRKVGRTFLFSVAISIPMALIVELIAFWDKAWVVPQSMFSIRFFGFIPIEDFLWQFFTVFTILIFYEYFIRGQTPGGSSRKMFFVFGFIYLVAVVVSILFINQSILLHIGYPYLWFGIFFFAIPVILFLLKRSDFFVNFLKVQLFFLYIHTLFELVGVKFGHWLYPSAHYVGWITLVGQRFPLEEMLFVMFIGAFAACTYYEYLTNDYF